VGKNQIKKLSIGDILKKEDFSNDKELVKTLSGVELKDFLKTFISHLKYDHKLTSEQVAELFGKRVPRKDTLPVSIFDNEDLSCLETIVKYLKEEFNLKFHEIALLLNRNDRTIWTTYNIACKKRKEKLSAKESKFSIPTSIFTDRKLSVLEALVGYLRNKFKLRYSKIAALLNRDERNMWSVYSRYKKKNGQ